MQNVLRKFLTLTLGGLLVLTSACGGTKGFSLAKKQERSLDDCLMLAKKKKHDDAIQCLEAFRSRNDGRVEAAAADLALADSYFAKKDWTVASQAYDLYTDSYPTSEKAPYAYFRAGVAYLKQIPKTVDRDQNGLEDAQKNLSTVLTNYPNSPYAVDAKKFLALVRTKMAKKDYYVGRYYFKTGQLLAAAPRFQTVVMDYAGSGLDDDGFYYLIKSLKKTEQSDLAMKYFELFKKHYPDHMQTIKKMAALF